MKSFAYPNVTQDQLNALKGELRSRHDVTLTENTPNLFSISSTWVSATVEYDQLKAVLTVSITHSDWLTRTSVIQGRIADALKSVGWEPPNDSVVVKPVGPTGKPVLGKPMPSRPAPRTADEDAPPLGSGKEGEDE